MPDDDKTDATTEAENKKNREQIKQLEESEPRPRGNVHSEPSDGPHLDAPPPPMPH